MLIGTIMNYKYYIVYETRNIINNKIYVGVHKTENINDSYLGSGVILKKAIKKYGRDKFVRKLLNCFRTSDEAYKMEKHIVNGVFKDRKDTYNVSIGGIGENYCQIGENNGMFGKKHSKETIKKLSKLKIGKKRTDESKKKQSKSIQGENHWNYGKKHSDITNKKNSDSQKSEKSFKFGKPLSYETKNKISKANKGKKRTSEQNKRNSDVHNKLTPEEKKDVLNMRVNNYNVTYIAKKYSVCEKTIYNILNKR